ncbi:MAG: glycine cleavage system protein GcvH [Candidatus Thermoplasmatota archaeon]|nr:glycine cleavage system protein GcvH [Candidatus Thermoplasmatota archaeon]
MAEIREGLEYTETHEWVKREGKRARIGVTDYAQQNLTDVVYVDLPQAGKEIKKGEILASIESVKSVSDVYSPASGKVVEVNSRLNDEPELINKSPYDDGWLVVIELAEEPEGLIDAEAYKKITEQQ